MILTNAFDVTFNTESIDRDFDIFLVEKKGNKLYQSNILDLPGDQFRAQAVQYFYGGDALILFDKSTKMNTRTFMSVFRAAFGGDPNEGDLLIRKMEVAEFDQKDPRLLQLLVNSLRVPLSGGISYNNLSGELLYHRPEWKIYDKESGKVYGLYCLKISFDSDLHLNLHVKTFRRGCFGNKRRYLFDPENGDFRRKLKKDQIAKEDLFEEKGYNDSKKLIKFLNFTSFSKFQESKLGIMDQFLRDVKRYLGQYLTLSPKEGPEGIRYVAPQKKKENLSDKDYGMILNELGVNIVDVCQTERSSQIVERVAAELQKFYGVTAHFGALDESMYNIRVIHDDEYYEKNGLTDPHDDCLHGYIVQHMTQEANWKLVGEPEKKESSVIKKIVTELILKGDVHFGKIRIYDWKTLGVGKTWYFVRRDPLPPTEEQKKNREKPGYSYIILRIDPDGNMDFTTFNTLTFSVDDFWINDDKLSIMDAFESEDGLKKGEAIEGLVYTDIHNIHKIIRTTEWTMPDVMKIREALVATYEEDKIPVDTLLDALNVFKEAFSPEAEYMDELVMAVRKEAPRIRKGKLKTKINVRSKAGKQLNRFLHSQYGIWVSPEMKNSEFDNVYLLENLTEIRYFLERDADGLGGTTFKYYAGLSRNALKYDIQKACIVRRVQAEEALQFKELLPLLAVDFVRVGQYTVVPFPFKYLREYRSSIYATPTK